MKKKTTRKSIAYWTNSDRDMSTIALEPHGEPLPTYYNEDGVMCVKDPETGEEVVIIYS